MLRRAAATVAAAAPGSAKLPAECSAWGALAGWLAVLGSGVGPPVRPFSSDGGGGGGGNQRPRPRAREGPQDDDQRQRRQRPRRPQEQGRQAAAAGAWPQPRPLVLPERKATAPVLGRVAPSSGAAAAASVGMLAAARRHQRQQQQEQQQQQQQQQQEQQEQQRQQQEQAAADSAAAGAGPPPPATALPWEVVEALRPDPSSPHTLEQMAEMSLGSWLQYLEDARHGAPSVFELGALREQGRSGRVHLLRRERLLWALLRCLGALAPGEPDGGAAARAAAAALDEEALQEADERHLAEAAEAAAASSPAAAGATGEEVGRAVMDFFVARRCFQLMLLQRQHRQLAHLEHLRWQQQQQQQQSAEAAAEADIWDAFFDAGLQQFEDYLRAAAAGAPSVFTTAKAAAADPAAAARSAQELAAARAQLAATADLLARLPPGAKARPCSLTARQAVLLAAEAGASPRDLAGVLEDFLKLRRLGFRQALDDLMEAVGAPADSAERRRF